MPMDGLTLFGLLTLTVMLLFYALEHRSPWFVLAFAAACLAASAYGFLQGAWPFGVVEVVWALVAFRRWYGLGQASPEAGALKETAAAARAQASRRNRTSD